MPSHHARRHLTKQTGITDLLNEPAKYPGSSGTRNLADNLSDLRAQVAANHRGIVLVNELIDECGLDVVVAYMQHIQQNAEVAVREMLTAKAKDTPTEFQQPDGKVVLHATDHLDDGSPITLAVTIDPTDGSAVFDFTGTGP
jgi:5-oxoprolinase (ATP-hydrolysing)